MQRQEFDLDLVVDPRAADMDRHVDQILLADQLREILACLTPRCRKLLTHRFGLSGACAPSREEAARALGVTVHTAWRLESYSLRRLRRPVYRERLLPFVGQNGKRE